MKPGYFFSYLLGNSFLLLRTLAGRGACLKSALRFVARYAVVKFQAHEFKSDDGDEGDGFYNNNTVEVGGHANVNNDSIKTSPRKLVLLNNSMS